VPVIVVPVIVVPDRIAPDTVPVAVRFPVMDWLAAKVLATFSCGTTAVLIDSVPLVVIGLGLASKPAPAFTWVTVPLPPPPPPPQPLQLPTVRVPVMLALPWTSSVNCGVVVPMPTLTLAQLLAATQSFVLRILPSTSALDSSTSALEPMAVALLKLPPPAAT
jgi:hypothetical protein